MDTATSLLYILIVYTYAAGVNDALKSHPYLKFQSIRILEPGETMKNSAVRTKKAGSLRLRSGEALVVSLRSAAWNDRLIFDLKGRDHASVKNCAIFRNLSYRDATSSFTGKLFNSEK